MESSILICLEIPSVFYSFEARVPVHMTVREMIPLFVQMAADLSGGAYVSSGRELLCAKRQNILLGADATLSDYGIGNGDHLTLL